MGGKFGNPAHGHAARHAKRGKRGRSLKWPSMYDHLRAKGYSKEKAARISNAAWAKKKRGQKTNTPTSARGILKSLCPELADDMVTLSIVKADLAEERNRSGPIAYRYNQQNHMEDIVAGITKSELPQAVQDYIEALEEQHAEDVAKAASKDALIAELEDELTEYDGERLVSNSDDDKVVKAAIAKADPDTANVLAMLYGKVQKADQTIAKQSAEAVESVMISKAAELPVIHTDNDGGVKDILKTAYGVSDEYGDQVFEVLKHANHLIEQGSLFGELGMSGAQTTVAKSAEAYVAELRKENPDMSEEEALAAYYDQDGNYEQARTGQEV